VPDRVGKRLAVAVRAFEPAERGTVAGPDARDEEAHALRLRGSGCRGRDEEYRAENDARPHGILRTFVIVRCRLRCVREQKTEQIQVTVKS
jgi:hypothetical protein